MSLVFEGTRVAPEDVIRRRDKRASRGTVRYRKRRWEVGMLLCGVRLLRRWYGSAWTVQCQRCRRVYVNRNPHARQATQQVGCKRCCYALRRRPHLCGSCGTQDPKRFAKQLRGTCQACERRKRRNGSCSCGASLWRGLRYSPLRCPNRDKKGNHGSWILPRKRSAAQDPGRGARSA